MGVTTPGLEPTWMGHSIGKWRGDTLAVETVGYNDKGWFDGAGHLRTKKLRVVEEYRRPDLGRLEIQTEVHDPGAYVNRWITLRHRIAQFIRSPCHGKSCLTRR